MRTLRATDAQTGKFVKEIHNVLCGEPTTFCYPAMGGGYMALCTEHAQKHLRYCVTYEAAQRGERPTLAEVTA